METKSTITITVDTPHETYTYTHKIEGEYVLSNQMVEAFLHAYASVGYVNSLDISIGKGFEGNNKYSFSPENGFNSWREKDSSEEEESLIKEYVSKDVSPEKDLSNLTHYDWGMGKRG